MANIIIKPALNKDSKVIVELIFNIWQNEYHFNVVPTDFPDLQDIEGHYNTQNGHFLIAVEENMILGTIACSKLIEDVYVLKRMFVIKKRRKHGVAQLLINTLLNLLPQKHDVSIYLSTKENQAIAAKAFYLKNHFRAIERSALPDNFPYFYEDDLFMVRTLNPLILENI